MSDQKLRIEIETAATGNGIPQTAAGLKDMAGAAQKVAPALQQAGDGSKAMADGLGKSVAVGSATTQLLQNLSQVGQGGAAGTGFNGILAAPCLAVLKEKNDTGNNVQEENRIEADFKNGYKNA